MASKVKMKANRLDELLKEFGMTRSDVQRLENKEDRQNDPDNENKLDKKTVIKINKGEEVSLGSIEKLSDILSLPVLELIDSCSDNMGGEEDQDVPILEEDPFPFTFIFKSNYEDEHSHSLNLKGENLLELSDQQLLINADKIRYSLHLSQTWDTETRSVLGDLETAINILRGVSNERAEKVIDDTNLQELMTIEDAKQSYPNVLKILRKKGITVWGSHYFDYSRELIEDTPQAGHAFLDYTRESIFVIGITDSKMLNNGVTMSVRGNLSYYLTRNNLKEHANYFFRGFDQFRFYDRWIERIDYLKENDETNSE